MALIKQANATLMNNSSSTTRWKKSKVASGKKVTTNLIDQASDIFGKQFNPNDYLLTHCTIVASVDLDKAKNVKLGSDKVMGKPITRRWLDYLITPDTSRYINNNKDSFPREVLGMSYSTFIGKPNYQEHVQIPELSKGRIIDAALRDIGDSLYVDILVATDRKHASLIEDIENDKMGTLSMGCFLPGTQITMSDGIRVPIEEVLPGDRVLTHKGNVKPVLNKQMTRWSSGIRKIKASGVADPIRATDNHPFFVLKEGLPDIQTDKEFLLEDSCLYVEEARADELKEGEFLYSWSEDSQTVIPHQITSIEEDTYEGWVYDMEVEDDHSYVADGVAVHNCQIVHSTCSKCGNVAVDESEMCGHILYQKGNTFFDSDGKKRVIAENCGHQSEPNGGIEFIEASWVRVPAFTGAVLRSILKPSTMKQEAITRVAKETKIAPDDVEHIVNNYLKKVASLEKQGQFGEEPAGGGQEALPEPSEVDKFEEKVTKMVLDKVKKQIKEELSKGEGSDDAGPPGSIDNSNENLIREAKTFNKVAIYNAGLATLARVASSDVELLDHVALYNNSMGIDIPVGLYRVAYKVGSYNKYKTMTRYIAAAQRYLSRKPSREEAEILLRLGKLLSFREKINN